MRERNKNLPASPQASSSPSSSSPPASSSPASVSSSPSLPASSKLSLFHLLPSSPLKTFVTSPSVPSPLASASSVSIASKNIPPPSTSTTPTPMPTPTPASSSLGKNGYRMLWTLFIVALNVSASVGIVSVNKYMFMDPRWNFHAGLLAIHNFSTFLFTVFLEKVGVYKFTKTSFRTPLPALLTEIFCNSVSIFCFNKLVDVSGITFYQLAKLLMVPSQAFIQYFVFQRRFSFLVVFSLVLVCVGVFMTCSFDLAFSWLGLFLAVTAILTTCISHTSMQRGRGRNYDSPFAQLRVMSLYTSTVYLCYCLCTESDFNVLFEILSTTKMQCLLLLSSLCAFSVQYALVTIVTEVSALAYQLVGHLKTVITLTVSYLFFEGKLSSFGVLGLVIAAVGLALYTHQSHTSSSSSSSASSSSSSSSAATSSSSIESSKKKSS